MTPSSHAANISADTDHVLAMLMDQVADRLQTGEPVDVEELVRAHPEHRERIRQLLPAAGLLADLAASSAERSALGEPGVPDTISGVLADFRLIREIGRGGMGVVYEATQISLGRRVALKVLPFAATLDARQLRRFENEARAAAQLHHSNIVPVYAVGCDRGVHYYAMQLIDGRTLATRIHELRRLAGLEQGPAAPSADTPRQTAGVFSTAPSTRDPSYFRTAAGLAMQAAEA